MSNTVKLVLILAYNYLVWGSAYAFVKVALEGFSPLFLVGSRLVIASLVFTPIILMRFWPVKLAKKDIPVLILLVLCDPSGFFLFEAIGMQYTSTSQASMLYALAPLLNVVAAWLILRERATRSTLAAFFIAVSGVAALTMLGEGSAHASNPVLGNFFLFLCLCCNTAFYIIVRALGGRYPAMILVWIQCIGSSLLFTPVVLLNPGAWPLGLELVPSAAAIYLAVAITFLGQCSCAYGLARLPVHRMSALSNMIPLISLMFAVFMMGERLTPLQWLLCGVVLGAVVISQFLSSRAKHPGAASPEGPENTPENADNPSGAANAASSDSV